jgi:hypothetical protein
MVNPTAPDWAGAESRLPKARQARPDLTRVKSGKQKDCQNLKALILLRRFSP